MPDIYAWAIEEKLLKENALADKNVRDAMRLTAKPSRPVADKARYESLRTKADDVGPAFGVILDLGWHTGRGISAILGLGWQDVATKKTADAPNGSSRRPTRCGAPDRAYPIV